MSEREDASRSEGDTPPKTLGSFLKAEAIIVAASTAAIYLLSYFFQKSYLAVFNVPETFVELTLTRTVVAAASMLAVLISVWNWFCLIHFRLVEEILKLLLATFPILLIALVAFAAIWSNGFNLLTFVLFLVSIAGTCWLLFSLLRAVFFGTGYREWLRNQIGAEIDYRKQTVSNRILDKVGGEATALLFVLILVPFAAGSIFGEERAKRGGNFLTIELQKETFILVSEYRDGLVLASAVASRTDKGIFFPTGKVLWLQLSSVSGEPFRVTPMRLQKRSVPSNSEWIGLETFVWRLFGYSEELERR